MHHTNIVQRIHTATSGSASYIDEDGMHLKVIGWHHKGNSTRYLIQYNRPEVENRSSHSFAKKCYMPHELFADFQELDNLNVGGPMNQHSDHIELKNIIRIIDAAWYSSWLPACTSECIEPALYEYWLPEGDCTLLRNLKGLFFLIEWKDKEDKIHSTWEVAETLFRLIPERNRIYHALSWIRNAERRHEQILAAYPTERIARALGEEGWQCNLTAAAEDG